MQIPELKDRLSIKAVLESYNLRADQNQMLLCPFHEDEKASMKIYESTNTFHCFGCGVSGDQIEFLEKKGKITKHEAILKAKSLLGKAQIVTPIAAIKTQGRASQQTEILSKIFATFKKRLTKPNFQKAKRVFKKQTFRFYERRNGLQLWAVPSQRKIKRSR